MLDALRKQATGWVAQIFIGLLVLSFAVWGVSGFFTGFYADTVASVGKTDIPTATFARQYEQELQAARARTGRPLTTDQAQLFGIPGQVLGRLVAQATLDETARQYGIGLSDPMLARKIAEDPAFSGPSGNFDRLYFQQVLRSNGYTEDQFVDDQRARFLRYQVSSALVGAADAPEPYLRAVHEYQSEERSIAYVVLTAALAGSIEEPDEAELTEFFEENRGRWRAPQYRALTLFEVSPAAIVKPEEITDEEAQAAYDRNISQYTRAERRRVSQIHFDSGDEAAAAAAAIADGTSFDEVAGERKLAAADTDLGLVRRDEIIDPKVAEAAFSLAAGEASAAVEGDFGWVVVRVGEIEPGDVRGFADVKDEIKQDLAIGLGRRRIIETFDAVEDSRAAGETLAEIAAKIGAPLVTVAAVDQAGNDPDGNKVAGLPAATELLSAAFASDVGIENDAVRTTEGGYVWYEVTGDTAERERTLDEVRDTVIAAWKEAQIDERLNAEADAIRTRLEAGESIDAIAEELALEVKTADKLTRTAPPPADLPPAGLAAAFGGPQGHVAVTDGDAGAKVVLVVTAVVIPPFEAGAPALAQAREQISAQIANDYLQQFIVEKQDQAGIRVNQTALQSMVGQLRPGF